MILNSPSKSFNIAGLQIANIICSQPEWRRRLDRAININEVCDVNPFAPVALKAAYNDSEDWIDELNQYLWGNYTFLCDFIEKCADEKTTVFLLCNPHNPCGRVWTKEELTRMNDICMKYGVKVVSDEIHCELMMPGYEFQPFAAVSEQCRQNSVILNSPSKSFNIAGLQVANIICSQPEWRRRLDRAININEVCDVNPFAPVALKAAYNESEDWIDELNQYLWGNYTFLCDFIDKNIPQWKVCRLEGTYLPWVDISAMGISAERLCVRLLEEARVWINPGTMYGAETGKGYVRLNIACPRSRLKEALKRISSVISAG